MNTPQERVISPCKWLTAIALLNCSLVVAMADSKSGDNLSVYAGKHRQPFDASNINGPTYATMLSSADGMVYFVELAKPDFERLEQQKVALESLKKSQHFLAENSKKKDVVVLKSGLQYRIINQGNGRKPSPTDHITVHYEGRLMDGTLLDSSYLRNQPTTFQLNRVIAGWSEGIQKMPQGSVWELIIPPALAYGVIGIPGTVGPNEVIIFTVELKDVCQSG